MKIDFQKITQKLSKKELIILALVFVIGVIGIGYTILINRVLTDDTVMLKINDEPIKYIEFKAYMEEYVANSNKMVGKEVTNKYITDNKEDVLNIIVNNITKVKVMAEFAKENNITVDKKEYENLLFGRYLPHGKSSILNNKIIKEIALGEKYQSILIDKVSISEEKIKNYYNKNIVIYTEPEQVRIQRIFLPVTDNYGKKLPDAEVAKVQSDIAQIQIELAKPNADFGSLVKSYSRDNEQVKNNFGDVGFIRESKSDGRMFGAANALQIGQTSGLIEGINAYYFVKLLDKKPAVPIPLESIKKQVETDYKNEIGEEEFKAKLNELVDEAHINITGWAMNKAEFNLE